MANDSKTWRIFNRPAWQAVSLMACAIVPWWFAAVQWRFAWKSKVSVSIRVPERREDGAIDWQISQHISCFWNLATWYHLSLNASVHDCYHAAILLMIDILPWTVGWIWKGTSLNILKTTQLKSRKSYEPNLHDIGVTCYMIFGDVYVESWLYYPFFTITGFLRGGGDSPNLL